MSLINFSGEVLCMGAINMDLVMFMHRLPKPGETIVTDNFSTFPGGKGGNQAVTASVLGGKVKFFGKLAVDDFSKQLISELNQKGVDTSAIQIDTHSTAGIAIIRVDDQGQNSISFTPGANALLTPADVQSNSALFTPGAIMLTSMEINPETIYASIRLAKEKGMFVILDPAPAPREAFPQDIPALVDIIKPNETEASLITGLPVEDFETAEIALSKLVEMGFSYPIITLGKMGCVAWVNNQPVRIPPYTVQSIDTTAAGDVFSGALAASLANKVEFLEALNFAKVASALSTTVKGAQSSIPSLQQVKELL
jgi:ribokinase